MDTYSSVLLVVGVLILVLVIGTLRSRAEWIINFALRGVVGMMMVYFANYFFSQQIPGIGIGYNLITFLTSGILGFPGIVMLFGINFYMIL